MALHKLIEDTCPKDFPVAASSLLAGCYALGAMIDLFCHYDEDFPEHQIYYWMLRSMARVYGLKRSFDRTVVPPFAAALAKDVLADAPRNPRVGLDPDFRHSYLNDPADEMRRALRDNDRYDWKPLAPVFLHHGTHDDIVPFFCAQMAYEAMRARGGRVTLYPYLGKDHYQPVNRYVTTSLADFARLR
jgi:acetyl esterase/lipase